MSGKIETGKDFLSKMETSLKEMTRDDINNQKFFSIRSIINKLSYVRIKLYKLPDSVRIIIAQHYIPRPYKKIEKEEYFNRILDIQSRFEYQPVIDQMWAYLPRMMARKIPEANIQQAFVLDSVYKFIKTISYPKILCVGSYEDTAAASLKMIGYRIVEIDPLINYDLNTYFQLPTTLKNNFNVIFSTSVIEHVADDEIFISQIAELLAPGGVCILTCDYNNNYQPGDKLPKTNLRFYTKKDFIERLIPSAKECSLIDEPRWDEFRPDFMFDGCLYSFATLTFKKGVL